MVSQTKSSSETVEQYIWRMCKAKDIGELDLDWDEVTEIINRQLFKDNTEMYYSESKYRKDYHAAKKFYEAGVFDTITNQAHLKELKEQQDTIIKEKRKLYDQRREYNKLLISDARAEHLSDELVSVANKIREERPLEFSNEFHKINPHKEALLAFSDWHYGMVTDNIWNKYNVAICKERICKVVSYAEEYIRNNNISRLHLVMLGDAAHGAIHTSCRVKSEEETCDQLMHVAEIISEVVNRLSESVNEVIVYSCYGNHMRTIQNKTESVHSDNMEKIIPWWMKERLKDNSKVKIIESEYREFTRIDILGSRICCVHGDLDNFRDLGVTVNTIFSKIYGETIDYTVSGDKHHLEEFERFGIESILVRSLCGSDDYASEKRLYSKAGQTLMIFNDVYGREATYHITVS